MDSSDVLSLRRLLLCRKREVSDLKRAIRESRKRLREAATELAEFEDKLCDLGIEPICVGETHGRKPT